MRNLIIKREKSFVGWFTKLNVYIVDDFGDTTINNQRCRKLGTLKNGEEKTFLVDDWATRIYVIADKLSKGYCSDMYDVPAGTEDLRLSGACRYNLISGHAFRFNGPVSADVQAYRKQTSKKGWIVLIAAVILGVALGVLAGWLENRTEPKTFTRGEFSITLHNKFEQEADPEFDALYISDDVLVMVTRDWFVDLEGLDIHSLQDYGETMMDFYEIDGGLTVADGLTYFEYDYSDMVEGDYHYVCTLHEGADAYWIVEFATYKENQAEYADKILEWARSVRITGKTGASGSV